MASFFGIWLIVGFLGITLAAPLGPVNAEIIKQILRKTANTRITWLLAFLTGFGAMTGDFIVASVALSVGGEILRIFFLDPLIKLILFSINCLILGFLGFSTLFSHQQPFNENLTTETSSTEDSSKDFIKIRLVKQYITGLSLVMTSPWSYLWWASAGTLIFIYVSQDFISRLITVFMFLSGILFWDLFFSTSLTVVGQLPNPRVFQWITKFTALILLIFAAMMLVEAWGALLEILKI